MSLALAWGQSERQETGHGDARVRELLRHRRGTAQREHRRARSGRDRAHRRRDGDRRRRRPALPLLAHGAERSGQAAQRGVALKVGREMAAGGGGSGPIPAGFTYLGQFIDHDLTFDKTTVMLGQNVSPAQMLQARSPALDLDSLYGAGPGDPESAKFYSDDRHLKMGKTRGGGRLPRRRTASTCRAARATPNAKKRKAVIPDPRNDENLAVAQTHLAMIRFHNRIVDTLPGSVPACAALREGARARGQALPVDDQDRLPAADLPAGGHQRRLQQRAQGLRAERAAHRRPDHADRVLGRRLPARSLDDPARPTTGTRPSTSAPASSTGCSSSRRRAATSAASSASRRNWIADFRRLYDFGEANKPNLDGRGQPLQPGDADRHDARRSAQDAAARDLRRQLEHAVQRQAPQPRLPQPHARQDGQARHRPADGHVHEEQGREPDQADEEADPRGQERRRPVSC